MTAYLKQCTAGGITSPANLIGWAQGHTRLSFH